MTHPAAPSRGGIFPLCFSSIDDFKDWQRSARRVTEKKVDAHPYCEDCTAGYQWQMALQGRCANLKANPE